VRRASWVAALLFCVALVLPGGASAADKRTEKAAIADKLVDARDAVRRILAKETDVGTEVERAEKMLRSAAEASRLAAAELASARLALEEARTGEVRTREELAARAATLGPRLRPRYRMMRQGGAGALLLAESPAAWLRLQRAFDTLLAADLAALRDLRGVADAHALARKDLEAAEEVVLRRVADAQGMEMQARSAAEARVQLLAAVREERKIREQVVSELTSSQRRLDAQLARIRSAAAVPKTGFGLLRGKIPWPVEGSVVEVGFGKVVNAKFNTITHQNGLDLRVHEGAEVKAVSNGQVAFAGWFRGYGNLVIVDHGDGFHTLYAHLAAVAVKVGETVAAEQLVGLVGDTGSLKGAYLYFEIRANGKPLDPMPWFAR
jgi:septal ring factor EnvC (AmiA/AmiB activator)